MSRKEFRKLKKKLKRKIRRQQYAEQKIIELNDKEYIEKKKEGIFKNNY